MGNYTHTWYFVYNPACKSVFFKQSFFQAFFFNHFLSFFSKLITSGLFTTMCIPHIKRDCRLNDFQSLDFQLLKQQPFFISWLRNSIVSPFANSEQAPYGSLALIISQFTLYLPLYSRTRAIALFRPASHDCSFVNGAKKVNVCFAAASFSFALIISF